MVERMMGDFGSAHGLRSIALRYFNAAGADAGAQIGEAHEPETHLLPLALDAAAGTQPHLTVFGNQHPTRDGTCVRDYVHVSDLAQAHVLALEALGNGHAGGAFNLGNGMGFSVNEVIEAARAVTGRTIAARIGPARAGDPPSLVADAARVRQELGWEPRHPDLQSLVASAWRWHQRRGELFPK
jgi:UDP-arabinose 4-epimerase